MGMQTSNGNKNNNTTTITSDVCIKCLSSTIFVQFCDLVYGILAVQILQKSCINFDWCTKAKLLCSCLCLFDAIVDLHAMAKKNVHCSMRN